MNASAHRLGAALTVGGISTKPLAHAGLTAACGSLPDLLKPTLHPNHQAFEPTTAYGLYCAQAENEREKLLRVLALGTNSAYALHLAVEATTTKAVPLI